MSKQHTPGPWSYRAFDPDGPLDDGVHSASREAGDGDIVCLSPIHGGFDESALRWEANAKLIAAAPELLEALESVLDSLGALTKRHELLDWMSEEEADSVFAAIAKARGDA